MGDAALVLNAGSSSLKAALITAAGDTLWRDQRPFRPPLAASADAAAAEPSGAEPAGPPALEALLEGWLPAVLQTWGPRLRLAAHRVVHGGEAFTAPTRVQPAVLQALERLLPLAPLHNGPALRVIRWLQQRRPQLPQWACFDTAFHASLPAEARTYAIPAAWRRQGLRRYGFHGLNHQHVSEEAQRRLPGGSRRLISCHLGAGCSLCAIRDGRSLATSMGFTPLEGLVMARRSGSLDPGLLLHLLRQGCSVAELERELQGGSGLLGLSELSGDMRRLREAAAGGHAGARLAIDVFRFSLLQGIGAMAASLEGVEAIALSGGIGEHDGALRAELQQALAWLGPVHWLVVPADEEGVIARSCLAATGG
ncbi:MAG: acetate kinase [Synechococcaceae cyanobacterium]|nr:acetate kinase [Synechococcaceae cyanobacterium]